MNRNKMKISLYIIGKNKAMSRLNEIAEEAIKFTNFKIEKVKRTFISRIRGKSIITRMIYLKNLE